MTAQFLSGDHEVHRSLPFPKDREIGWLLDQGISDDALTRPWPVRGSAVRFQRGGVFDFDAEGDRAILFRAEDRAACVDLVAWSPRINKIASWRATAFCLGDLDQVYNPATYFMGGGLRVHRSPLDWLRTERDGIVLVRPDLTYAMLRHVPRLIFADAAHARQVQRWLLPPRSCVEFFIEVQEERRAA